MSAIIPIFIPHLGCPRDCVFCDQRSIASPRAPTPDEVEGQIDSALGVLPPSSVPEIAFYGGSFTAIEPGLQQAYLDVAAAFVRAGRACGIRLSTRPDCIDRAVLARLRPYPVHMIELGAQSMDDRVLAFSNRGHTADDTARAADMLLSAGYKLVLQMMTGLPGADEASDINTARALAGLGPHGARIYPTCVVRGTRLEEMYNAGEYTPQTLEQATACCAGILDVFAAGGIPVLRIGLNPTRELSAAIVAGPYHPSMGELARSRRLLNMVLALVGPGDRGGQIHITVPRGRAPLMRGQKNCNMAFLRQSYPHATIVINEDPGQTAEVAISTDGVG